MLPLLEKLLSKARELPVAYPEIDSKPPEIDEENRNDLDRRVHELEVRAHLIRRQPFHMDGL